MGGFSSNKGLSRRGKINTATEEADSSSLHFPVLNGSYQYLIAMLASSNGAAADPPPACIPSTCWSRCTRQMIPVLSHTVGGEGGGKVLEKYPFI